MHRMTAPSQPSPPRVGRLIPLAILAVLVLALMPIGPGVAGSSPGVPPVPGVVVQEFDAPEHRYAPGHRGVDLRAEPGTTVRAVRGGVIAWSGPVAGTVYVTIDHGGGLSTTYGGVSSMVGIGDHVGAGHTLGSVASGRTHLDWGARLRERAGFRYIDPMLLLQTLRPVLIAPTQT